MSENFNWFCFLFSRLFSSIPMIKISTLFRKSDSKTMRFILFSQILNNSLVKFHLQKETMHWLNDRP